MNHFYYLCTFIYILLIISVNADKILNSIEMIWKFTILSNTLYLFKPHKNPTIYFHCTLYYKNKINSLYKKEVAKFEKILYFKRLK